MADFNEVWFVVQAADGETYRIKGSELSTKLKDNKLLIEDKGVQYYVDSSRTDSIPNDSAAICYDEESDENYWVPGYTLKAGSTFDPSIEPKVSVRLDAPPSRGRFTMTLLVQGQSTTVTGPSNLSWNVPSGVETTIQTDVPGEYSFDSENLKKLSFQGSLDSEFYIFDTVYTANVTDMSNMFFGCTQFNQNISWFDTGSVTNMNSMFEGAKTFNQDISNWEVGNVTSMDAMFKFALAFDQDLSSWCLPGVTNVSGTPEQPDDFDTGSKFEGDNAKHPVFNDPQCVAYNPDPEIINPDPGNEPNWTGGLGTRVVVTDDTHQSYGEPVNTADPGYNSRGYEIGGVIQPELAMVRGEKYVFDRSDDSNLTHTDVLNIYTGEANGVKWIKGVTLTAQKETIFKVPTDAPDTLYYQSSQAPKGRLGGKINITD